MTSLYQPAAGEKPDVKEIPKWIYAALDALNNSGYLYLGIRGSQKPIEGAAKIVNWYFENRKESLGDVQ